MAYFLGHPVYSLLHYPPLHFPSPPQTRAAETGKARSPTVQRRVGCPPTTSTFYTHFNILSSMCLGHSLTYFISSLTSPIPVFTAILVQINLFWLAAILFVCINVIPTIGAWLAILQKIQITRRSFCFRLVSKSAKVCSFVGREGGSSLVPWSGDLSPIPRYGLALRTDHMSTPIFFIWGRPWTLNSTEFMLAYFWFF